MVANPDSGDDLALFEVGQCWRYIRVIQHLASPRGAPTLSQTAPASMPAGVLRCRCSWLKDEIDRPG